MRQAYAGRLANGPRTSRHIYTNFRYMQTSAERVEGSCILTLYAANGEPPFPAEPLLVADYDDEYALCADGRWRFARRRVTWIFRNPRRNEGGGLPLGGRLTRPVLQKYDSADLVNTFLADPQKRLKFSDEDLVQQVERVFDVPTVGGRSRLLGALRDATTGKWFRSVRSPRQPALRKLFLETHKRFYLVVCQLHCDAPGFPRVAREKIWLDPGIGFGKRLEHNLALLAHLEEIAGLGFPVLLGVSRKRFVAALDLAAGQAPDARLAGSLAAALRYQALASSRSPAAV